MSDVVIVGSINVDLMIRVERHPHPGETLNGEDAVLSSGGKGANQAVAAALLGSDVSMVGAVGTDPNASAAVEGLLRAGVHLERIASFDGPTGMAIVVVDQHGENAIIVSPGANSRVTPDVLADSEALIRQATIVVLQGEIPTASLEAVGELITGRLVFNLAPVVNVSPTLVRQADPLVVNEHEAALTLQLLTGKDFTDASDEVIIEKLVSEGVPSVVMTRGPLGALVRTMDEPETVSVPSPSVSAVDTTGAGDAFVGALVTRLSEDSDLANAVRFAVRVGAFACTRPGAQSSYPTHTDDLPTAIG